MSTSPLIVPERRILTVVVNDRQSESRTPARPLYPIPAAARDPYSAQAPLPHLRIGGEADLTRNAPGRQQADGEAILITGRILDEDMKPVRGTLLEVWNCNTYGRYSHVDDSGNGNPQAKLDPNFYGHGRVLTDDEGRYAIRTIKPGAYVARPDIDWWRPPHVHFSVVGGGVRLVTQMYFPNEPLNEKDYIYLIIPASERQRVIAQPVVLANQMPGFTHDIVVRGRYQTPPDLD